MPRLASGTSVRRGGSGYYAIIVGARCAGSSTAMLLARQGIKVLLSTEPPFQRHDLHAYPLAARRRDPCAVGPLATLAATGAPPIRRHDVRCRSVRPSGRHSRRQRRHGRILPRRTVLDSLLVNAASESGVEVREGFFVDELLVTATPRGHSRARKKRRASRGTRPACRRCRRRQLFVARAVRAPDTTFARSPPVATSRFQRRQTGRYRTLRTGRFRLRRRASQRRSPSRDGELAGQRLSGRAADLKGTCGGRSSSRPTSPPRARGPTRGQWYAQRACPASSESRTEKDGAHRRASYNSDPVTAQGISDGFIEAERLAEALSGGWSGACRSKISGGSRAARNERVRPMYECTTLAALEPPPPETRALFGALHGNQDATTPSFAITRAIPLSDFMSDENLARSGRRKGVGSPAMNDVVRGGRSCM